MPLPSAIRATCTERPFWSVMIPTYSPSSDLLDLALRSVLDQDPGPDRMQIAVVDDASPSPAVEEIVRRLAPGRVEFHRSAANRRLAGNWNRCVELARGRWVHLLHQDDLVRPGYYERLGRAAAEHPEVGSVVCRYDFLDESGAVVWTSDPERTTPGILDGWFEKLAGGQRLQCPAVVVRRDVYEALGGFRDDLLYVLDWEMWVRIAARYPVWYEPETLACYRIHPDNETARLQQTGADAADLVRGAEIISRHYPVGRRAEVVGKARRAAGGLILGRASAAMRRGDRRAGVALIREAVRLDPALRFHRAWWGAYLKWSVKLAVRDLAGAVGLPPGRTP